jgi:hypothetical protein
MNVRYAAKRDGNEPELVRTARQVGAFMVQVGPLDWWACFRGRWYPVEIKNPEGKNKLTDAQVLFLADCRQYAAPVWIWRTEADVFDSLGARQTA